MKPIDWPYQYRISVLYLIFTTFVAPLLSQTLTHWGRDKMADISQTIFSNAFLEWKCMDFAWLKCVSQVRINNISALVQIMAWRRQGDKPLSEPMMVSLLMHTCITRPQRVNKIPVAPNILRKWKSRRNPAYVQRNKNLIVTSKWRFHAIITFLLRNNIIKT